MVIGIIGLVAGGAIVAVLMVPMDSHRNSQFEEAESEKVEVVIDQVIKKLTITPSVIKIRNTTTATTTTATTTKRTTKTTTKATTITTTESCIDNWTSWSDFDSCSESELPIVVPVHIKNVVYEVNSIQLFVQEMVILLNTNTTIRIVIIMDLTDSGELVS